MPNDITNVMVDESDGLNCSTIIILVVINYSKVVYILLLIP